MSILKLKQAFGNVSDAMKRNGAAMQLAQRNVAEMGRQYELLGKQANGAMTVFRSANQMQGFNQAMEEHRLNSGAGGTMGDLGGEEVELYQELLRKLQDAGKLDSGGVSYNPHEELSVAGEVLAMVKD